MPGGWNEIIHKNGHYFGTQKVFHLYLSPMPPPNIKYQLIEESPVEDIISNSKILNEMT